MFYELQTDGFHEIQENQINPEKLTTGYMLLADFKKTYSDFGFSSSTITSCESKYPYFRSNIEIYDDYSFARIHLINTKDIRGKRDKLAFFIKQNLFLVVELENYSKDTKSHFDYALQRFKPDRLTLEKLVFAFFDHMTTEDVNLLEMYNMKIDELEADIETKRPEKQMSQRILTFRKDLLLLNNYYDLLDEICVQLVGNTNDLFGDSEPRYFTVLSNKMDRLSGNARMIRDNLNHAKDAYDSALDYDLNTIMKVFTVVTTIFLPLSLITGWFGMNFANMPELAWEYSYPCVILASIGIVIATLYYFKKKNLM